MLEKSLKLPCGVTLPNRLVKAAMTERLARGDHNPNERHLALYSLWGQSGAAILLTGNIMIDRKCLESAGNVCVEDERAHAALKEWARVSSAGGCALWAQIGSSGRQTSRLVNLRPVSASAVQLKEKGLYGRPRALTGDEIRGLVQRFARTAAILKSAGFGGVQVHSAHGYLLSQFLSPLTNLRTDEWGGSLENRARFLIETVRAVRAAVGPGFPVGVKLNSSDFQKGGFDEDESLEVVRWLAGEKIDLLEISGGNYEKPSFLLEGEAAAGVRESTKRREAYFLEFARRVRAVSKTPLLITGGFRSREFAEEVLKKGEADLIGLARPFLTDRDFGRKFLSGEIQVAASPKLSAGRAFGLMAEGGFYDFQIARLAAGKDPALDTSAARAVAHILWGETRKSVAHQLFGRS